MGHGVNKSSADRYTRNEMELFLTR